MCGSPNNRPFQNTYRKDGYQLLVSLFNYCVYVLIIACIPSDKKKIVFIFLLDYIRTTNKQYIDLWNIANYDTSPLRLYIIKSVTQSVTSEQIKTCLGRIKTREIIKRYPHVEPKCKGSIFELLFWNIEVGHIMHDFKKNKVNKNKMYLSIF